MIFVPRTHTFAGNWAQSDGGRPNSLEGGASFERFLRLSRPPHLAGHKPGGLCRQRIQTLVVDKRFNSLDNLSTTGISDLQADKETSLVGASLVRRTVGWPHHKGHIRG